MGRPDGSVETAITSLRRNLPSVNDPAARREMDDAIQRLARIVGPVQMPMPGGVGSGVHQVSAGVRRRAERAAAVGDAAAGGHHRRPRPGLHQRGQGGAGGRDARLRRADPHRRRPVAHHCRAGRQRQPPGWRRSRTTCPRSCCASAAPTWAPSAPASSRATRRGRRWRRGSIRELRIADCGLRITGIGGSLAHSQAPLIRQSQSPICNA